MNNKILGTADMRKSRRTTEIAEEYWLSMEDDFH
jgi:hypothetical protein